MDSVRSVSERLARALTDHLVAGGDEASDDELVLRGGGVIRLWAEDGVVHAEIDSAQGGPEVWVFAPGRDELDEFIAAVVDDAIA